MTETMNRRTMLGGLAGVAATGMTTGAAGAAGPVRSGVDYSQSGAVIKTSAPVEDGFYFPAEWEPHEATVMQFVPPQNWYGYRLDDVRREWAAVANTVAEFEPVIMAVRPEDRAVARRMLMSDIELMEVPVNDGWSRDSGPMIVVNDRGARAVAGFAFNGWGNKFRPYDDDAQFKARFAARTGMPFYEAPMVLEGGAVICDGEGTCITTEECLLHTNRNPGASKAEINDILHGWLGVEKVIWLPRGLTPDPITDGHVDGIAAYVSPGVVMVHLSDDADDPNRAITRQARDILTGETDARGRRIEVIALPLAATVSHINYYVCNGGVVVPTTGDRRQDDGALGIIGDAFAGRTVAGVPGVMLSEGGGGVHCITQQIPAVRV